MVDMVRGSFRLVFGWRRLHVFQIVTARKRIETIVLRRSGWQIFGNRLYGLGWTDFGTENLLLDPRRLPKI